MLVEWLMVYANKVVRKWLTEWCVQIMIYIQNGISRKMKTFIKAKSITCKSSNGFDLRYNRNISRLKLNIFQRIGWVKLGLI